MLDRLDGAADARATRRSMTDPDASLSPLVGGHSGRTFVSDVAGERTVVRSYPPDDPRGPDAVLVDEAAGLPVCGVYP